MAIVKIITAGNVIQTQTFDKVNRQPPKIKRLSASQWVNTETGEVYTPDIKDNRKDTLTSSMSKLRDIINANTDNPANIRWVTLTYAENMTDTKRLYKDLDLYTKRLYFYCLKHGYPTPEYITAIEPQERGAWHTHSLLIWQDKAPYISNKDLASIWKHGFVKINQPKNCDNFGAYLSAYLTDTLEDDKTTKRKGNRLHLYPRIASSTASLRA